MLRCAAPHLVGLGGCAGDDTFECRPRLPLLGRVVLGHPTGNAPRKGEWVGLPPRLFLYTIDQIAVILSLTVPNVKRMYVWYEGREIGVHPSDKLRLVNIAPDNEKPEWRSSEQELIRWMKEKKFRYYERGWVD